MQGLGRSAGFLWKKHGLGSLSDSFASSWYVPMFGAWAWVLCHLVRLPSFSFDGCVAFSGATENTPGEGSCDDDEPRSKKKKKHTHRNQSL